MALEYDPKTNLRHYPVSMAKYGQNQYGENLYRIVFAESRRHLVGGLWPNGELGYHWVPRYRQVKAAWILERWYTPFEYTKMSRQQYERTMVEPVSGWPLFGPYPERGDYDLAWEFDLGMDAENLDNIIGAIERGRSRSFEDLRAFNKAEYEQEEKDTRNQSNAEIRDACMAFGSRAFSSQRVARGIKTAPILKTAEELGLPIPRRPRAPKTVTVRRTQSVQDIQVSHTLTSGRV